MQENTRQVLLQTPGQCAFIHAFVGQVDLLGVMVAWNIQLNAVSLVNLTMALGIAVEFCAHVVHAFVVTPGTRPARAAAALREVGASVLSGITLTKIVGAAMLAHSRTLYSLSDLTCGEVCFWELAHESKMAKIG
jgi:predicted RND superfamily exporter protein